MNEIKDIHNRIEAIISSVDVLTETISSSMARCEERLLLIEKLLWSTMKKGIDQDKLLDSLASNTLIDQLVKRKEIEKRIKPLHLQSEAYRKSSSKAMQDRDDEDE